MGLEAPSRCSQMRRSLASCPCVSKENPVPAAQSAHSQGSGSIQPGTRQASGGRAHLSRPSSASTAVEPLLEKSRPLASMAASAAEKQPSSRAAAPSRPAAAAASASSACSAASRSAMACLTMADAQAPSRPWPSKTPMAAARGASLAGPPTVGCTRKLSWLSAFQRPLARPPVDTAAMSARRIQNQEGLPSAARKLGTHGDTARMPCTLCRQAGGAKRRHKRAGAGGSPATPLRRSLAAESKSRGFIGESASHICR